MSVFDKFVAKYGRLPTEFDRDYLEMVRMSKYRIVDVPDFAPGKCANCGSCKHDGRKYVDFGLQIDWFGTVYLCGECLHDVANSIGLFDSLRAETTEIINRGAEIEELHRKGKTLHELVNRTHKEFSNYYDDSDVHTPSDYSSPDFTPDVDVESPATESGTDEPESRVTKSTPSTRSKNVRSLADLLTDEPLEGI